MILRSMHELARGAVGVSLASFLLLAAVSRELHAQAATCRTTAARPDDDIVVPLADERTPNFPATAIRILPGEEVCITGWRRDDGQLVELAVMRERSSGNRTSIGIKLEQDGRTRLSVWHDSRSVLHYSAGLVATRQRLALLTKTLAVHPGVVSTEDWNRAPREVLLFDFGLVERASGHPMVPKRKLDIERRLLSAFLGLFAGERQLSLIPLGAVLSRDGFASVSVARPLGGLEGGLALRRLRFDFGLQSSALVSVGQRTSDVELSTSVWRVEFGVGFDLLRYRGLNVFGSAGIGGGAVQVDASAGGSTLFRGVTQPWEGDKARWSYSALPLTLGADYLVPVARESASERWALYFGARISKVTQLGGAWETDENDPRELTGLPQLDASGFEYRLALGVSGHILEQ